MPLQLPPQPGLSNPVVRSVPDQWDAQWFRRFITNYLKFADARNAKAAAGSGIIITGTLTGPATFDLQVANTGINPVFQAGAVIYSDPTTHHLTGNNNLIFGTAIPNPAHASGGVSLLIGTGGTANPNQDAWIITDQAFTNTTPGNTLGISAGATQSAGTANGGLLWLLGGASFGGVGGELRMFGGTSANGNGGIINIQGGGATGAGIPGDCFLSAGQTGTQGANIHIISTTLGGVPGAIRLRNNSTLLYEIESTGALFIGNTVNSFGLAGQAFVSGGPGASTSWLTAFTGTITTAKLTTGGANGSMTFASGFLISQVPAT